MQREEIVKFVGEQKKLGRPVTESLKTLGVKRASYYRWAKPRTVAAPRINSRMLTPQELATIDAVKEMKPELRHRKVQGEIQKRGTFVSYTSVYRRLKSNNLVEPYRRREAPWEEPHYEVWQRCTMWGADWTKMRIAGLRWYLLTLIDFYSRVIEAWRIVPTVDASCIKALYLEGLANEGVPLNWHLKPELRVDQGSPNTSRVTKDFFKDIAADLSFARVRRPTDNAMTERFYGTIKQEEIYVVGDYPDLQSANEEIGKYINFYNNERPHQALWNFTPAWIHDLNNKTEALCFRRQIKNETLLTRKNYWLNKLKNDSQRNAILSH